jgi:integrase
MNVKIDIHENSNIDKRIEILKDWKVPEVVKEDVKRFLEEFALGKVNLGKKGSARTQVKYLSLLRVILGNINKPIGRITEKDVEEFDKDLTSGKIKTNKGNDYAYNVKVDIRRALRVFLKWKLGQEKGLKLAGWLDTREKTKTPDYLKESEIEKLYKNCKSAEERFLIALLFDSGARAEELHNIRYEDITLPEKQDNFVKIALKEEYSKTLGRTISLYWKHSLESIRDYIKEREQEGIKSTEPVFKKGYDAARMFLFRLGKKVLKKEIYYHLFRHSSATYYATKLNRQELCYRYGWKFSSDMPDVYISRSGMENKQLDEKFSATELEDLKKQLDLEKTKSSMELELLKKQQLEQQKELEKRKQLDPLLNELFANPQIKKILQGKKNVGVLGE